MLLNIRDGEKLREELAGLELKKYGLGGLIRLKDCLLLTMAQYENPTLLRGIQGIDDRSPDYQTAKPLLEGTLERIYAEIDRRERPN